MTWKLCILFISIAFLRCTTITQSETDISGTEIKKDTSKIERYQLNHKNDDIPSEAIGTVSNGQLKHGKLFPFNGENYQYFDTNSYIHDRAYLHDKVLKSVLETYVYFETKAPGRQFTIMECSGKSGGQLYPHRTHQNGLSIDFMMPLVKNGEPFYEYDNTGQSHYLLDFDNTGRLTQDTTVSIDFELAAQHILALDSIGKSNNISILKVIINTDLKDELYSSTIGNKLKTSDIYVVQSLTPLINSLHDDHYHIDFQIMSKK